MHSVGRLPMVCACEGATPLPAPPGLARLPWGGKGEDIELPSLLRTGGFHLAPPLEYHPAYFLRPLFLLSNEAGNPRPFGDFFTTTTKEGYDMRRVDITPLEQRKLTFDTHALVQDLEAHGFDKAQAETIVSALTTLSSVSLDSIYKEMVTRAQQEITVQQLMSHLDSIRKDMVILEKSEFANLRAENQNETSQIRADNKLDINLERSRVTDMFTDQEKKLMEATTEFTSKDTKTRSIISETSNKIDTEIASLKTLMESNKLETIRYLADYFIFLWGMERTHVADSSLIHKIPD
ncbi:coiled-coil domain-containing protein 90B, mitochondrial isoform X3 [Ailuropoda melanoleuca]|uniref:coiled-coil domain-containing protein 90B, mitochondrial isoform X3 n=1 Tax=Ailuropoda melanoleuca TaxID=9646 RepID=UPI001494C49E|nr:coiled-coil domain-containing protein 90B, mitochondrial isoform X3 [Ailuropoda melanoleuca]